MAEILKDLEQQFAAAEDESGELLRQSDELSFEAKERRAAIASLEPGLPKEASNTSNEVAAEENVGEEKSNQE